MTDNTTRQLLKYCVQYARRSAQNTFAWRLLSLHSGRVDLRPARRPLPDTRVSLWISLTHLPGLGGQRGGATLVVLGWLPAPPLLLQMAAVGSTAGCLANGKRSRRRIRTRRRSRRGLSLKGCARQHTTQWAEWDPALPAQPSPAPAPHHDCMQARVLAPPPAGWMFHDRRGRSPRGRYLHLIAASTRHSWDRLLCSVSPTAFTNIS